MALNPNHTVEELDGKKCSVVEKNCSESRANFLKELLEANNYTVQVARSKVPPSPPASAAPVSTPPLEGAGEATYTVGVTDLAFNPKNVVYNRLLKTKDGKIVTLSYWKQDRPDSDENSWYWILSERQ